MNIYFAANLQIQGGRNNKSQRRMKMKAILEVAVPTGLSMGCKTQSVAGKYAANGTPVEQNGDFEELERLLLEVDAPLAPYTIVLAWNSFQDIGGNDDSVVFDLNGEKIKASLGACLVHRLKELL